jgi:hypothetical protein
MFEDIEMVRAMANLAPDASLMTLFAGIEPEVELENWPNDERNTVTLFVKSPLRLCGTPWACLVNLNLIPDPVPRYTRRSITWATLRKAE